MKRSIDYFLTAWKTSPLRQPLLLRGARQVGKTYAARTLGTTFTSFVELNFEHWPEAKLIFDKKLDPKSMIQDIYALTGQAITPGETLLFLDEIQAAPNAIIALRYFYEMMPELHVLAAGSLLDFAIEQVGMPVGRVSSLYMYPLSFIEFASTLEPHVVELILNHHVDKEMTPVIHDKFLGLIGQYLAIGGLPKMVDCWKQIHDLHTCSQIPHTLLDTYKQDFNKYARKHQLAYLSQLFTQGPRQVGKKFKYSTVNGELRKRELAPCLDLLLTANIMHKIFHTAAQGIPLGAEADESTFKVLFIDVALSQYMLDLTIGDWFLNPLEAFVNKGELVEAFVGQELIAYANPKRKAQLYYWQREARDSEAEVDYVIQQASQIIPIEVKSGKGTSMKSMRIFLESHPQSPYGIRFSSHNYSIYEGIHSYPLYAIAKVITDTDQEMKNALSALIG